MGPKHQYYKGWPKMPVALNLYVEESMKDTIVKILKVAAYVISAVIGFLGGLQF